MNDKTELIEWLKAALLESQEQRDFYDREVRRLQDALMGAMDETTPQAKEQAHFLHDIQRDYLTD